MLTKANTGRGSFSRMKQHMTEHVASNQDDMFQAATTEVKKNLNRMCDQIKAMMRGRVEGIFEHISRDYMSIVGVDAGKSRAIGKAEKEARTQIDRAIAHSEGLFSEVLECEPELLATAGLAELYAEDEDAGFQMEAEDASIPLADVAGEGFAEDAEGFVDSEGDDC